MRFWRIFNTKTGLQFKMTLYVTLAVLLVSSLILFFLAFRIRGDYMELLDERVSDDMTAITQNIEQRMLRLEDATEMMANISSLVVDDRRQIDSLLYHAISDMDDVRSVAMILREGYMPNCKGRYERYAFFDEHNYIRLGTCTKDEEMIDETIWHQVYVEGKSFWLGPVKEFCCDADVVVYLMPLINSNHQRIGVAFATIPLSHLTFFVTQHKVRKDIDISVFNKDGEEIVPADEYIHYIAPKDLIIRECEIELLGWRLICSADKNIINTAVQKALIVLMNIILVLFVVIAVAIWLTVRYIARPFVKKQYDTEMEKAIMDSELKLAANAQKDLLPHVFPPFPDRDEIDIAACLYPARDVGGDLYDYYLNDDKLYFCVGDVSGKGLQASLFMSAAHYLFRSVAGVLSPSNAMAYINKSLCSDNEQCRFITFWYGCLNLKNGELEYVNAGHDAPILLRNGIVDSFPMSENMPLGVMDDVDFISNTIPLVPGDALLLYTDGVTEAMNAAGKEFGRERTLSSVASCVNMDALQITKNIYSIVKQHAAGYMQSDDITMLCVRFIKTNNI
ncbi:MAG: SpoIIE family protein phosphatase [Alistipes sp.]|nr:SpoIIE family protein phosphatase [Candidatus Alistipes equi]